MVPIYRQVAAALWGEHGAAQIDDYSVKGAVAINAAMDWIGPWADTLLPPTEDGPVQTLARRIGPQAGRMLRTQRALAALWSLDWLLQEQAITAQQFAALRTAQLTMMLYDVYRATNAVELWQAKLLQPIIASLAFRNAPDVNRSKLTEVSTISAELLRETLQSIMRGKRGENLLSSQPTGRGAISRLERLLNERSIPKALYVVE